MNLQNFKIVKLFTNRVLHVLLFVLASTMTVQVRAWSVDLSRRQEDMKDRKAIQRGPSSIEVTTESSQPLLKQVFMEGVPEQEIVILNTSTGFVPNTIRLKKNQSYKIHVVNVNDKQKNVSFIMDSFSEHHATYFGEPKAFSISPKTDGVFSFQCPETANQGKIVVYSDGRSTASE